MSCLTDITKEVIGFLGEGYMEIYKNDYVLLEEEHNEIFLTVLQEGFTINDFNELLLSKFPNVSINQFLVLKEALENGASERVRIGQIKPLITVTISNNKMQAKIKLNCTDAKLRESYEEIRLQILNELSENNVTHGILYEVLENQLEVQKDIIVARGTEPTSGRDAIIKCFQKSERKPTIKRDGKADFYEMNFVDEVHKGDWLGEKYPHTKGAQGKTVTGEILIPKHGRDLNFVYDHETIGEFDEGEKKVYRALVDGVVEIIGNKISVGNHLVIDGDVGVETGNISFEGSITIRGTVKEGFSVTASKDISIEGELGLSRAQSIVSKNGDIFIKGGVFGKGETLIKAGKNVFVKHANECIIEAGEDINIGYYSIGSVLKGRNITTDKKNGKLIGGIIEAKGKIETGTIGNYLERKTVIHVKGFDREKLLQELEELLELYRKEVQHLEKIRRQLDIYESFLQQLNDQQSSQYHEVKTQFEIKSGQILLLEQQRNSLSKLLQIKGEGQISIEQIAYPETMLQIKHLQKRLKSTTKGIFYAENNQLHFE